MTTADELLAEDGAVLVPRSLASTTFNALVLHLADRVRADGCALSPEARTLLRDLHRAASHVPTAPTSSEGSAVGASEILGAHEVADILGCSRRWATALLGSGRLESTRVGRTWVTTRRGLDAYRYGREEERDGEVIEGSEGGSLTANRQGRETSGQQ